MSTLLRVLLVVAAVSVESAPPVHRTPTTKQPNILFLMCDSMDGRVLDPTSDVWGRLEMPNLRRLASEGVNFIKTYAASPQCVPSRTTMFTGRTTDKIKTWNNDQGLSASKDGTLDPACVGVYNKARCTELAAEQAYKSTIVDELQNLGCQACLYGKVDVGANIIHAANEANATVPGFHSGAEPNSIGRAADILKPTKPTPLSITNDKDNNVHPEDWKMIKKCEAWFEDHDPNDPTPWFHYCSVNIPHPAFNTNATWLALVNDDKIEVPTWIPEEQFHPADRYMSVSKNVWGTNYSNDDILRVRKTYYAMCAETDFMLGQVMNVANKTNHLGDNTFIIFVSDHGEMNMEHRQVWKNSMYEASERVPMIISGPGVKRGVEVSTLTSLLDIFPTIVDLMGGTIDPTLDGYSLAPLLGNVPSKETRTRADFVTAQYHSNMGNTGSFMIRHGSYKLIAFGQNGMRFNGSCGADCSYPPQLFNVDADPEELSDISKTNSAVVDSLDAMLKSVIDYQMVDLACKREDLKVYNDFIATKSQSNIKQLWSSNFMGFDCGATDCGATVGAASGDWLNVENWLKQQL